MIFSHPVSQRLETTSPGGFLLQCRAYGVRISQRTSGNHHHAGAPVNGILRRAIVAPALNQPRGVGHATQHRKIKMRKFFNNYRHLSALLAVVILAVALCNLGMSAVRGFGLVACWQLIQFAMSHKPGVCFISALTPEQVREFSEILEGLKDYQDILPSVKANWSEIKDLPALVANVRSDLDAFRRLGLRSGDRRQLRPGQVVTDDCAEFLGAIAITIGQRTGKLDGVEAPVREALLSRSRSILSVSQRTALSSSDIPLPVEYSGQVVALVNDYGTARRYGTVLPLGAGTLKLPKLKTDTAFGLISQSSSVPEKSPQTEWVTFAAEKFGGLIRLPAEMAEDSIVGIGQFIASYAARQIAAVEDAVFFMNLDGSTLGAVKGLCGSTIDNSKVVQLASTKTHYSDATVGKVRELRTVPDAGALRMSAYYMHPSFEQLLSTFNSAGDRPYNPNAQLANASAANPFITGPTLDGFPVRWVPAMPAYSTSANVSKVFMLFGDLSYQYLGVRGQFRFDTSKEAAFTTDEILIRAIERFTIGLMATGAIGGLQTAAS